MATERKAQEMNVRYCPFRIDHRRKTFVNSIETMLAAVLPYAHSSFEIDIAARIFKALKKTEAVGISDLKRLRNDEIDIRPLNRVLKQMQKAGIIQYENDRYILSDTLATRLRNMADLIDSYMGKGIRDPVRDNLKYKRKLSLKAAQKKQ